MKKNKGTFSVYEGWVKFVKRPSLLINDWLQKEEIYLQKKIRRNSVVLDVGCGFGKDIKAIAGLTKEINGIDCNPEAIRVARKRLLKFKNVKIFQEDAKKTAF